LGLFVLSIGFFSWLNCEQAPTSVQGDSAAMGRAVYVSEGCIHCHSQYIRPIGSDNELWGPLTAPEMALRQQPVLIGNRRQGPDLANVALRRSRDWNQRHLIDPGEVTPGSRMPAYAHLFEGTGERGAALLDYLDQLGPSLKSD
jgi:cytochrome c oxidase cbb3-type subunit 2